MARLSAVELRARCAALYERLLGEALKPLISDYWVIGGARELGLTVSDREVRQRFGHGGGESRAAAAKFRKYLRETGETVPDLLFNLKVEMLERELRAKLSRSQGPVTPARVAAYYAANKQRFAVIEQRDLWLVRTKRSAAVASRMKRELLGGVSFAAVAKRLAGEQPPYTREALLVGLQPHAFAEKAINDAIFSAPLNVVSGPVRLDPDPGFDHRSLKDIRNIDGYYLFKVAKITPGYQPTLARVKAKLAKELPGILEQAAVGAFVQAWRPRWRAKTDCSPGYVVRKCRQYKSKANEPAEDPATLN